MIVHEIPHDKCTGDGNFRIFFVDTYILDWVRPKGLCNQGSRHRKIMFFVKHTLLVLIVCPTLSIIYDRTKL